MISIKKSVRLTEPSIDACRIFCQSGPHVSTNSINWSGSLNSISSEYLLIMQDSKPELSEKQWGAIYQSWNGYMPTDDPEREAQLLAWRVAEAYEYDSMVRDQLGDEEEIEKLCKTIKSWSLTTKLSAIFHAKWFWAGEMLKPEG